MLKENLIQLYAKSFASNWKHTALHDYLTNEKLTYGDLAGQIARIHIFYQKCGIKPGDKIALLGKNTIRWVTIYMATLTYGAVIVPILPEFNPQDAQHIVNHSESKLLFVSESIWETLEFNKMPMVVIAMSLDKSHVLAEHPANNGLANTVLRQLPGDFKRHYPLGFNPSEIKYAEVAKDAVAEINYTSGTTGFSKGVMLTFNNLCGNVMFGLKSHLYYPGSHCLSFLPLAHAYGAAFDMLVPLAAGASVTLFGKMPTPRLLLKALGEVRPHLILCVPLILEKIYRTQILPVINNPKMKRMLSIPIVNKFIYGKIRRKLIKAFGGRFTQIIVGGAPLNHEVEDFLYKIKFPFTVGYGMTECGPLISYSPWDEFIPGSAGRTLPVLMQSKALSPDPAKIPGEICVKGENVMVGYFKNPEATEAVLDSEGWLHTGDMGTITSDGTIFIRGRNKTMILSSNGQNIYPEEIEAKLNNMPYVAESLIVERGHKLVALVYPDYEATDKEGISHEMLPRIMEQVKTDLNKMVAPYERIDEIQLRPTEFEKTPKRSIKRFLYK